MDGFQKEYIKIIKAAFTDQKFVPSSDFDWTNAVNIANEHNIASILFYGAINCGISQETEYMQELYRLTLKSLVISTRQAYEIAQIEDAFTKENIDYMPLKGAILKSLYPKPEMRTMGDADILIKPEQYSAIEKIISQLGFSFQYESDHELTWKNPSLFLELHKGIIPTYDKDFYQYFGDGWKIAGKVANCCRYEMSTEDFYIYIFVHFAKHYRIFGIGIKHILDLWVYIKAYPDLNWEYVVRELEKINLAKFHQNILKTIDVWFNDGEETDITNLITTVIFNSGQYGSKQMATINYALQKKKNSALIIKLNKIFGVVFLPYTVMKEKYTILKKVPVLLPIFWIGRCFDVLFHQNAQMKNYLREIQQVKSKQVDENKRALSAVGLDFR